MARQNHTGPRQGARHYTQAVAFCCGIVLAVLFASPLRADYVITGNDGEVTKSRHYWIQADKLSMSEGNMINVYSVKSVDPENLSLDEAKRHGELMEETRAHIDGLLNEESSLRNAQLTNVEKIAGPDAWKCLDSREKEAFTARLRALEDSLDQQKTRWKEMMLPDFSLLYMRDIKMLQLLSLEASIEHTVRFIQTGDPTFREYAKVQMDQVTSFDESFKEALPWK